MTDAAFVMIFLCCGMKGAQTLLGDGDTGWHLRTGEWILAHGRVLGPRYLLRYPVRDQAAGQHHGTWR